MYHQDRARSGGVGAFSRKLFPQTADRRRVRLPSTAAAALVPILAGFPLAAGQPPGPAWAIACAPTGADTAAVLAAGAVHVTRDGGATWVRLPLAEAVPAEEEATVDDGDSGLEWGSPPFRDDGTDDPEAGAGDDETEAEWIDDPEPEAPAEEDRAVTLLAVADDGRFALARETTLVLGGPGPGSRRELSIPPGARGMRFDAAGSLWLSTADRLLRFDPGGAAREVPVAVAGAPARGPDGGVLVPLRSGLLLVGTDPGATTAGGIRSLPVAADRVVAWDPARPDGAVVAVRGRLERVPLREGPAEAVGRGFPDADRLLAGHGGVLFLRRADADPERSKGWMRTTNLSQILPRFKVTVDYDLEHDESLDRDQVKPDKWGADTDRDLELQLSAQWELSRLVFNPDEVRVYGALANRAQRRESLLAALVGYYYERRKLQLTAIVDPPTELADVVELRLRVDELTAMIDALTGGLLSRTLGEDPPQRAEPR